MNMEYFIIYRGGIDYDIDIAYEGVTGVNECIVG